MTEIYRTMSIIYSHNVVLENILVNNTGNRAQSCKFIPFAAIYFYTEKAKILIFIL
jgi:hypothetical protein